MTTRDVKQYKPIIKYYNKELKKCHRLDFRRMANCMNYFYIYLKYMRDIYILTETNIDVNTNLKLGSIIRAVSEYEQYYSAINKYYSVNNGVPVKKEAEKTTEEVLKEYTNDANLHLNIFWQLVSLNMESWFTTNEFNV